MSAEDLEAPDLICMSSSLACKRVGAHFDSEHPEHEPSMKWPNHWPRTLAILILVFLEGQIWLTNNINGVAQAATWTQRRKLDARYGVLLTEISAYTKRMVKKQDSGTLVPWV